MNKIQIAAAFALASLLAATPLAAQTIVSDMFSGASAAMTGRMPDTTNLPGGTYTSFGSTGSATVNGSGLLAIGPDIGASLSIASNGNYSEPAAMSISAGLQINTIQGSDLGTTSVFRGVGLGFYSTATGSNGYTNFLGIVLNSDGSVSFSQAPGGQESNLVPSVPWPTNTLGAFSTSSSYVISYTINTAPENGGISNVSISSGTTTDTSDYTSIDSYSGPNPFTTSTTAYTGFVGTGSNFGGSGFVTNFVLATADVAPPTGSVWTGAVNAVWATAGNWTGNVPGATSGTTSTDSVLFNADNLAHPTPTVDVGRNVQNISFDNSGGNLTTSLTLGTTSGNALLLTSGGLIQTTFSVVTPQNINAPLVLEGAGGAYTFASSGGTTTATLNFGGQISGGAAGTTTLTLAGTNGGGNTISGPIVDGSATHVAVTQSSGAWTLSGANTFTGPTTVNGGTLTLASGGSLGNTAISVNGGTFAVLPGTGTLSAGTTGTGSQGASLTLSTGATFSMVDGQIGTFNLQQQSSFSGPALNLSGGTMSFDMGSGGADKLALSSSGQVSASGTTNIGIATVGSSLGTGPYTVISAPGGGLSGGSFQFTGGGTTKYVSAGGSYYQLSLNVTNNAVTVSAAPTNFIILDTFNVTTNTNFVNHVPDINVPNPGGMYSLQGDGAIYDLGPNAQPVSYVHVGGFGSLGGDLGAGVPIASNGNYTEPTKMTISAGLQSNSIQGGSDVWRGVGVGFYSQMINASGQSGYLNFQGIVLGTDGTIYLVQCGSTNPKAILAQDPWPSALGAFSTSSFYTITYTIDSSVDNGGISNFSVSNGTASDSADFPDINGYADANPFTVANVAYAGFTGSSGSFPGNGLFNNFSLVSASGAGPTSGWNGSADATWANPGNWTGAVPGATTGTTNTDTAMFNQAAPNSPLTIDMGRNVMNVTFDTASVPSLTLGTVGGNPLLLTAGGTMQITSSVVNPQTINAPLVLEGNYTITNNASNAAASFTFGGTIKPDASLTTTPTLLTLNGSSAGVNFINGVMSDNGSAKLAVEVGGTSLWVFSGVTNTYSGGTTIDSGATLQVSGSVAVMSQSMNVTNSGSLFYSSNTNQQVGSVLGTGSVTVSKGSLTAYQIRQNSLTIGAGAKVTLSPSGSGSTTNPTMPNNINFSSSLNSLTIAGTMGAWTGTLDIGNNGLVIAYGTSADPYVTINNMIETGFDAAHWDGKGITSSLGAAAANSHTPLNIGLEDFTPGTGNFTNTTFIVFQGQTVTTNAILVRLTYMDDIILAGDMSVQHAASDALIFAANYGTGTTFGVGDLTHTGLVGSADALLFAANYATGLASLDGTTGNDAALLGDSAAVPEPASIMLAAIGALALCRLPRRRERC